VKWYKFDIEKHYDKSAEIGDLEDLAFRRMVDLYYLNEKPLYNDQADIADAIGMDWKVVTKTLLMFFRLNGDDNCWHNEEIDRDLMKRLHQVSINRQVGQKGGRPKSTKS
jgi:uncharacterized protein YdaU (DUF1376 family)